MFHFLLSLLIIIIISQLFGTLAKMIGQPKVVGEMIGGILAGPSFLGILFPSLQEWLFNKDIKEQLYLLSQLGISLYMFLIGIQVRKEEMENSLFKNAIQLALVGIIPTFSMIFAFSWYIYPSLEFKLTSQLVYSLFMSASISVTAFPVLVRILDQQKMIQTKLGRFVILGASIDDVIAWIMLPIILSIASLNFSVNSMSIIIYMIIYLLVMFFIIKPILKYIVANKYKVLNNEFFALFLFIFLFSSLLSEKIGLHAIFGGFIAGLIVPRLDKVTKELDANIQNFVSTLLVPIYFVSSGFNVDLSSFMSSNHLVIVSIFIVTAFISKYFPCLIYAKTIGYSWGESSAVGALMNARGLMILIFANIGLSSKLISNTDYSILFLVAIVTTALTSPLVKKSLTCQTKVQA
ncbi:cation:proton antiporter [Metabacillus fastidiosus]|uniref:cation:proton antiporter n=1 Tax=Metabacillus fastidiosus TaxID=1458 RepID=UPI002E244CCF|nr:cation:proton antiporter [Metabacillus fastidiosus]MED4532102.1 cation:proton antiporter [Metabacillus fastidiosus]